MRVYMCMHACGWVDVAHVEVVVGVGGVSANVPLSLCIPTSMLMSIFLTHPPFARFYTLVSLACKALSIICLRENIVFFLFLLQSSPLSVSAYLIHSAPLITLFFTSLNHSSTTSSSVCLFHLLSHPASHFYLHLHQRCPCVVYLIREVGLFFFFYHESISLNHQFAQKHKIATHQRYN